MEWKIDYAKSAGKFINEHRISEEVRELIKNLIRRINGEQIKIDLKKLKGKWQGYLRIRKGKIRIILKVQKEEKCIFVKAVDFRGNVY